MGVSHRVGDVEAVREKRDNVELVAAKRTHAHEVRGMEREDQVPVGTVAEVEVIEMQTSNPSSSG